MKNHLLLFFLLFGTLAAHSNDSETQHKFGLRLYSSFQWEPGGLGYSTHYQFGKFSPAAVLFTRRGNFHELGIDEFSFSNPTPNAGLLGNLVTGSNDLMMKSSEFAWHYEYGQRLFQKVLPGHVSFVLGANVGHAYGIYKDGSNDGILPDSWIIRMNQLDVSIVPRLSYQLSNHIGLELSYTKNLTSWQHIRSETPGLSGNANESSYSQLISFPPLREVKASLIVRI